MAIVTNNMTAAEITADLTTLQSRMQFNTPEIYINGAIAFLTAFTPANSTQFTFDTISSTQLVVTQNSTGIVWTINGSGFDITNPFLTGIRTSETFQFPANHVTLASTPHLETGNFTFTITDTDLAGANVQVMVNNFVASQSTVSDAGIVGVLQGAFSADGNGTSTAFSLTNGTKALSISGFSPININERIYADVALQSWAKVNETLVGEITADFEIALSGVKSSTAWYSRPLKTQKLSRMTLQRF